MNKISTVVFLLFTHALQAQVVNTGLTGNYDSVPVGKLTIGGMVDTYYGFDFNEPAASLRPYCVSSARHNEININLAYIDLKYRNEYVRAHLVPGFGTYVNDNYATEKGSLKNLIEANAGVRISKKRDIWIDAGILGSPYTNESAISKDHLMYTRSFAPEFVPYYLAGVKLSVPFNEKWSASFYVLNGWQQIQDNNNPLAFGTQVEYRPTKFMLLNWDTYAGDEYSATIPENRTRYFTDLYMIWKKEKWSATSCVYAGMQNKKDSLGQKSRLFWGQANFIADYKLTKRASLAARIEYFTDPGSVQIVPLTPVKGFQSFSGGVCFNLKISENAMFRIEDRLFFSPDEVYLGRSDQPSTISNLLITNLTVWF
jgi:hypothetical protein